jgi:hypothetical protein
MTISLKITDSIKSIEKNINSAIAEYINTKLNNNSKNIVSEISSHVPTWLRNQPEIVALLAKDNTSLAGYFGIAGSASDVVNAIVNSVTGSLIFKFVSYNNSLTRGGFEVYIQPENFANLLGLPQGHTIYQGGDLHWLDWLLIRGDAIIVSNYQYNPSTGLGRSGLGNMIKGGAFRVPPQFAGTKTDNFVTRALSGNDQDKILTNIFDKYLG